MAITRAQQARQMLKQGSEPVEQAGVMNYMPSKMVTVPKIAKSSPDTPTAKLAYITPEEEDILVDLNLYGSLKGKPNKGPGGVPSLEGDFGPGGKGDYSEAGTGRGVGPSSTDKDVSAFTDKGTGQYSVSDRPQDRQAVIDYAQGKLGFQKGQKPGFFTGPGSLKQRQQVYNLQQRLNAIDRYTKARKNKILSGLNQLNINPAYDEEDETFADLISEAPSIASMTDRFSPQTISDVLAGKRQIDFFSKIDPNLAPGLATKGLVGLANLVGPALGGPVTQEKLNSLLSEIDKLENIDPRDTTTKDLMKEFAPNQYDMVYGPPEKGDGGGQQVYIPQGIMAQAPNNMEQEPEEEDEGLRLAFRAEGGPIGGEYDFESARQMYGLGKLVKKVTRTVKKIAKSPIGKVAIAAGIAGMPFGGGKFFGSGSLFGKAKTFFGAGSLNPLLRKTIGGDIAQSAFGSMISGIPGGGVTAAIAGTSLLAGLLTPQQEEEAQELSRGEGIDIEAARRSILERAQGNIAGDRRATAFLAEGGKPEPVAKKTMPLLDMGGQEMDLRAEGGFVPIGRMEKADDVPARLSKNEFVFTADAVRNAGDGNVDKGAEVMYNMMKNLEAGGEVSEESQGLEGARKMFQTSQRLEEVL